MKGIKKRQASIAILFGVVLSEPSSRRRVSLLTGSLQTDSGLFSLNSFIDLRGGGGDLSQSNDRNTLSTHTLHTNGGRHIMKEHDPHDSIGGGAINEKIRTFRRGTTSSILASTTHRIEEPSTTTQVFRGTKNQAHFLHAMEGLDRYPNYISRWTSEDVEELENALLNRLERVRQQRQTTELQRERILAIVTSLCEKEHEWKAMLQPPTSWDELRQLKILDERTHNAIFRSKFFQSSGNNHTIPSIQEVLDGHSRVGLDVPYLLDLIDEEMMDVYSFPLLTDSFCDRIQAFMTRVTKEVEQVTKDIDDDILAGSLQRTRNLDNIGLSWLNDLLFQLIVRPISRQLYQEAEMGGTNGDLDWRHGYITAYSADPDIEKPRQRLVPHTDDSEVTLNVCIGGNFEGGQLVFRGLRGTVRPGEVVGGYTPERGRALLHAGRQFHEVTEVTSGDRFALIMWTRSWGGIRSKTCPCCWMNRRQEDRVSSCICGDRWN